MNYKNKHRIRSGTALLGPIGMLLCLFLLGLSQLKAQSCTSDAEFLYERWDNLTGSTDINELKNHPAYPNSPDASQTLTSSFAGLSNQGSKYGARISALICVPQTGDYTFWVAADDNTELWLSTDYHHSNKQLIAFHTGNTNVNQWTKYSSQESAPINLIAGQMYYIEALVKQGHGGDNLSVGWELPDGTLDRPISNSYLSLPSTIPPYVQNPVSQFSMTPSGGVSPLQVSFDAGSSYDPNGDPITYAWNYGNGQTGTNAQTSQTYTAVGSYTVSLTVTDNQGNSHQSSQILVVNAAGSYTATGELQFERWDNIGGSNVSDLVNHAHYPAQPDYSEVLTNYLEMPSGQNDQFGARISAQYVAPQTGDYVFWIAGDDKAELWLSSDFSEGNKQKIAFAPNSTSTHQWTKYTEQESTPIHLDAGQAYYIEALVKQNWGGKNLAVKIRFPDLSEIGPIDASDFSLPETFPLPVPPIQTTIPTTFVRRYAGSSSDAEYKAAPLPNGNIILAGSGQRPGGGHWDFHQIITDPSGNVLNQRIFETDTIAEDAQNTGNFNTFDIATNGDVINAIESTSDNSFATPKATIIRMDESGVKQLFRFTLNNTVPRALKAGKNNGFFLSVSSYFGGKGTIFHFDELGQEIWGHKIDVTGITPMAIHVFSDNSIILLSRNINRNNPLDRLDTEIMLIKFAADGTKTWEHTFRTHNPNPGTNHLQTPVYDIEELADGSFVFVGGIRDRDTDNIYHAMKGKFSANGTLLSSEILDFGAGKVSYSYSALATPDSGYIIAGGTQDYHASNLYEPFLIKYNQFDQAEWFRVYDNGITSNVLFTHIYPTPDGGLLMSAGFPSATTNSGIIIKTLADGRLLGTDQCRAREYPFPIGIPVSYDEISQVFPLGNTGNVLTNHLTEMSAAAPSWTVADPTTVCLTTVDCTTDSLTFDSGVPDPEICNDPGPGPNTPDNLINWSKVTVFGEDAAGNEVITGESISYTDGLGRTLQSQSRDRQEGHVLASEQLRNAFGVTVGQTFPAPIGSCNFAFDPGFITDANGGEYNYEDFDDYTQTGTANTRNNPAPIGGNSTLGEYYSSANTVEEFVPYTDYAYSRAAVSQHGVTRAGGPGHVMRMGNGHEVTSATMPVQEELNHYIQFRDDVISGVSQVLSLQNKAIKNISRDVEGRESVSFYDLSGNLVATCLSGDDQGYSPVPNSRIGTDHHMVDIDPELHYVDVHVTKNYPFIGQWINASGIDVEVYDMTSDEKVYGPGPATGFTQFPTGGGFFRVIQKNTIAQTASFTYQLNYYNFVYYYYDLVGRQVLEVQPEGVNINSNVYASAINQALTTKGKYHSWFVLETESDESGLAQAVYRDDGTTRFTQDAKQANDGSGSYAYISYDPISDRMTEVGVAIPAGNDKFFEPHVPGLQNGASVHNIVDSYDDATNLPANRIDQVFIKYDLPDPDLQGLISSTAWLAPYINEYQQKFLLGSASSTWNEHARTWYSYDELGRLTWTVQEIQEAGVFTVDYHYDYQGNLLETVQNRYKPEESTAQKFEYDRNDALVSSFFKEDIDACYIRQVKYDGYIHGGLKRMELGPELLQLQGVDYVFNHEGRLKAINSPSFANANDPGQDGSNGFAQDIFGMRLDYYENDYDGGANAMFAGNWMTAAESQYNGLIGAVSWKTQSYPPVAYFGYSNTYKFSYDDRYQLSGANFFRTNGGVVHENGDYDVSDVQYDRNGNIQQLKRNAFLGTGGQQIDDLSYHYAANFPNRLTHISDAISNGGSLGDIEDQAVDYYGYNELGQMVDEGDVAYEYNTNGLITRIYREDTPGHIINMMGFVYDEGGQRSVKITYHPTANALIPQQKTFYIRDAGGNVISIYEQTFAANGTPTTVSPEQREIPVFGAGRIGLYRRANNGASQQENTYYELTDHLGNVRAVIQGIKATDGNAIVVDYADFYPFGWAMPGRREQGATPYRYAYQGIEEDPETGWNFFALRHYDARIGRFANPDPYGQYFSPYLAMGNNPVSMIDPSGGFALPIPTLTLAFLASVLKSLRHVYDDGTIAYYFSNPINIESTYTGWYENIQPISTFQPYGAEIGTIWDEGGHLRILASAGGKNTEWVGFDSERGRILRDRLKSDRRKVERSYRFYYSTWLMGNFQQRINPILVAASNFQSAVFGSHIITGKPKGTTSRVIAGGSYLASMGSFAYLGTVDPVVTVGLGVLVQGIDMKTIDEQAPVPERYRESNYSFFMRTKIFPVIRPYFPFPISP